MAAASLLALLDDISTVLDDVAVLTKVAARKTAGVLGDDLALNAEQVSGVRADRELPVVWAVAKGSFINKAILIPAAIAISAIAPWAVTPLLVVGGLYLCYEGFEKVLHALQRRRRTSEMIHSHELIQEAQDPVSLVELERTKIKGAIRTDFVLSAEIVTIALGSVAQVPFGTRVLALCLIGLLMTVGVYGFVALIVKMDDLGVYLCTQGKNGHVRRAVGHGLLAVAPRLLKSLTVIGTVAMFLVGGGIVAHAIPAIHHLDRTLASVVGGAGSLAHGAASNLLNATLGLLAGALVFLVIAAVARVRRRAS